MVVHLNRDVADQLQLDTCELVLRPLHLHVHFARLVAIAPTRLSLPEFMLTLTNKLMS